MTDQPPGPPRQKPQRKPRPLPTVLAALAVFGVAFEFLAFQLSAGKDPALGRSTPAAAPVTRTRPAKKLIITKVIPAGGSGGAGTTYSSSGQVAAPAPVITSSS
jgi:hypothetical protein